MTLNLTETLIKSTCNPKHTNNTLFSDPSKRDPNKLEHPAPTNQDYRGL